MMGIPTHSPLIDTKYQRRGPMSYTYSAFISYRHLPKDIAAAKAVQQALETYRIPADIQRKVGRKKLNRCFRDQDEMPIADDLGSSITKALNESEWLIVICTPELPNSLWCLREVSYFIEIGRRDRIIPILVEGEPKTSFPPQIVWNETEEGREEVEPLAADLRGNMRKQLRTEKLRIVARMLNLNYNDLKKREKERELRNRLALVSAILAVALCFAGYAIYKNKILTEERNASARNATQLLIEKSVRSTAERELGSGLSYALQAYEGSRIFGEEYDEGISAALEAAMYPEMFSSIGSLRDNGILHRWATLSNDGKYIACRQADRSLQIYSSTTGEKLYTIRNFGWFGKSAPDLSPDNRYVCRFQEEGVTLYDIADGTEVLQASPPEGWVVSYDGLTVLNQIPVSQTDTGAAGLFDPFTGKISALEGITLSGTDQDRVAMHRSGRRLVWSNGTESWIVDAETGEILLTLRAALSSEMSIYAGMYTGGYTEDDWYFRYWNGEAYVYLRWDTLEEVYRNGSAGVLSPDGTLFATTNGTSGFTLWDAQTGEELWTEGHNSGNTLYSIAFVDDDTLLASHEEFQIYRLHDHATVYDSGKERTTYGYDFAAGRLVMALRAGGCLVNLLPEKNDVLPHMTVETRDGFPAENLAGLTTMEILTGYWDGMFVNQDWSAQEPQEQGLRYTFEDREYVLHPVNGVMTPFVYVSPDGKWQAMIRDEEVDIFRAEEGPEPVMTIPGNGYMRLCVAMGGDLLALGSYVENLILYDLSTGDCLGSVDTGAMCMSIQFSRDARHVIAYSAMTSRVTVASTQNFAPIMRIPVQDPYAIPSVGFTEEGTEAVVLYPDGHADVGLMYENLDTLVKKAKQYTE